MYSVIVYTIKSRIVYIRMSNTADYHCTLVTSKVYDCIHQFFVLFQQIIYIYILIFFNAAPHEPKIIENKG